MSRKGLEVKMTVTGQPPVIIAWQGIRPIAVIKLTKQSFFKVTGQSISSVHFRLSEKK